MIFEKRKHRRFLTQDKAYAVLGNHFTKVGKLQDISIGGLAFRYIENTEDCVQGSSTVGIFVSEDEFYLPDLACRLVYDAPLYVIDNTQYSKISFRINRCGVQFKAINEYQLQKLEFFINHYTRKVKPS